jgi:hypothetical protein
MSRDEFDEQRQLAFEMSEKAAEAQDEIDGGRWRAEAFAAGASFDYPEAPLDEILLRFVAFHVGGRGRAATRGSDCS